MARPSKPLDWTFNPYDSPLIPQVATLGLELAAFGFAIEPFFASAFGGLSGLARFGGGGNALNQGLETVEGIVFVLLLGAVLLSLENNDAVFRDAAVVEVEQALFVEGREG